MKVPFLDLKKQYKSIKPLIDRRIQNVIKRQEFINGKEIEEFERRFANFCGKKYCVGVSSGTAALFLAYKSHGIGSGWNVLSVPNTFIATTETITATGANLHFTDVKDDGSMDINSFNRNNCPKIDAIVPVHLFGNPCDMNEVFDFARENEAIMIEDCCQAVGASVSGYKVPLGTTGCFSYYPGKNLGSFGDSGSVVTNDKSIAEKVRMLRDHGRTEKYKSEIEGYNFRMDEMQAAVLNAKLPFINKWNKQRQMHAKLYTDLIVDYDLPVLPPGWDMGKEHVFHLYVIRCKHRDSLQKYLKEHGIQTGIHYPYPLHKQPAYKRYRYQKFPMAEQLSKEILSLPMFPELTETQIRYVILNIKRFFK